MKPGLKICSIFAYIFYIRLHLKARKLRLSKPEADPSSNCKTRPGSRPEIFRPVPALLRLDPVLQAIQVFTRYSSGHELRFGSCSLGPMKVMTLNTFISVCVMTNVTIGTFE